MHLRTSEACEGEAAIVDLALDKRRRNGKIRASASLVRAGARDGLFQVVSGRGGRSTNEADMGDIDEEQGDVADTSDRAVAHGGMHEYV